MSQSDYIYALTVHPLHEGLEAKVLLIIDLNLGNRSVTNDIENVLKEISLRSDILLSDHVVFYRDSEGDWDEVQINREGEFADFAPMGAELKIKVLLGSFTAPEWIA